jgi:hypothetical protein
MPKHAARQAGLRVMDWEVRRFGFQFHRGLRDGVGRRATLRLTDLYTMRLEQFTAVIEANMASASIRGRRTCARAMCFVHVAEPVNEHLHHMSGEKGILLDDEVETPFVHPRQARRFGGDDCGPAGRAVDQRHLSKQCAARGLLHCFTADPDVHRAFQKNEHAVGGFSLCKEDLAGSEVGRLRFVFEKIGGIHEEFML